MGRVQSPEGRSEASESDLSSSVVLSRASFSYKPGVFRVQAESCAIKGYRPTEEVEKDGHSDV